MLRSYIRSKNKEKTLVSSSKALARSGSFYCSIDVVYVGKRCVGLYCMREKSNIPFSYMLCLFCKKVEQA